MALGRTFAGLMQAGQPYWDTVAVSANQLVFQLTKNQRDRMRIVSYVHGTAPDWKTGIMQGEQFKVSGSFATAFMRDDGKVVKVTTDPADIAAMLLLRGEKHLPQIYELYELHNPAFFGTYTQLANNVPTTQAARDQLFKGELYAAIVSYVEPLPPRIDREWLLAGREDLKLDTIDVRAITAWAGEAVSYEVRTFIKKNKGLLGKPDFAFPSELRERVVTDACKQDLTRLDGKPVPLKQLKAVAGLQKRSEEFCVGMSDELLRLATLAGREGIELSDLNERNIGIDRDSGTWVISDLGASETYTKPVVEAVNGLMGYFRPLR